jgi:hypothetical protein
MFIRLCSSAWHGTVVSRLQKFEAVGSFALARQQIRALLPPPRNQILALRIVGRRSLRRDVFRWIVVVDSYEAKHFRIFH